MSAEQIPLPCSGCCVCCITEAPGAVLMAHDKSGALICARGAGQAAGGLCRCPGTTASIPSHPSTPRPIRVLLPPLLLPGSTPYLLPLISFNQKKKKKLHFWFRWPLGEEKPSVPLPKRVVGALLTRRRNNPVFTRSGNFAFIDV